MFQYKCLCHPYLIKPVHILSQYKFRCHPRAHNRYIPHHNRYHPHRSSSVDILHHGSTWLRPCPMKRMFYLKAKRDLSFGCHQNGLRCQSKHFETSWLDRATSVSDDTNAFWKNSTRSIPCGHSERNSFLPNEIYIVLWGGHMHGTQCRNKYVEA